MEEAILFKHGGMVSGVGLNTLLSQMPSFASVATICHQIFKQSQKLLY